MKITLKNARKTLRFVTAKEQVFSFRAVSFFFVILIYLFIFIFSVRGVLMIIFTFLLVSYLTLCMLQVKSFSRLNQNFLYLKLIIMARK